MKPNLDVLIDLAKGEDSAMWGDETIDYRKDSPFPYQYNKYGLEYYHFTSLEHLILFFYGTDEQQAIAEEQCEIYVLKDKNGEDIEDEWILSQPSSLSKKSICIPWSIEDVAGNADDMGLTISKDQAWDVLQAVKNNHDASIGVNWDTIEEAIRMETYTDDTEEQHDISEITYKGVAYRCRTVSYNGTDYKVSTESLNKVLIGIDGTPIDEEASRIDESIYFYMPDDMIAAPDEAVIHLLKTETDIE